MAANIYDLYRVGSDGKSLEGFKVNHTSVSDFSNAVMTTVGTNNIARSALAQKFLGKSTAADMRSLINARENTTLTSNDINDFRSAVNNILDSQMQDLLQAIIQAIIQYFAPVRNTASGFTSSNTVLHNGQIGIETDTNRIKIGDGTTGWNDLSYVTVEDTLTFASN